MNHKSLEKITLGKKLISILRHFLRVQQTIWIQLKPIKIEKEEIRK